MVSSLPLDVHFAFIIGSETEFEEAEKLAASFEPGRYSYHPFFNGQNLDFFREGIFVTKENLLEAKPALKELHARQVMNPLHFGSLTVLNDRWIYANVNASRLGMLGRDSIYDVVYREMYHGKSWRRTRNKVEPCKRCVFNALCPPLSNYEYAVGKNNLCHLQPRL
jgi:pseudo-rSAM protein